MEESLLDIEIPSKRYDDLTKEERDALYSLKDEPSIIIKDTGKSSAVAFRDREDYLKEAYKQLVDREVYRERKGGRGRKERGLKNLKIIISSCNYTGCIYFFKHFTCNRPLRIRKIQNITVFKKMYIYIYIYINRERER